MLKQASLRTTTRLLGLSAFLLLTACSGRAVHQAKADLLTKSYADVVSCVGAPNKSVKVSDAQHIEQWDYDENKISGSLSMSAVAAFFSPVVAVPASLVSGSAFSISGMGNCRAVGTFVDDHLVKLTFGGDNTTLVSGRDGVCEPLFRGCLQP